MSASAQGEGFLQSPAGKALVVVVILAAICAVGFEVTHMSFGGESRHVSPQQEISENQQQIDAINKMTNLSPQQKQQMIAHYQGEINTAKGAGSNKGTQPQSNAGGG